MKTDTAIKKLDSLLELFAKNNTNSRLSIAYIISNIKNTTLVEVYSILEKLIKDGYVSFNEYPDFQGEPLFNKPEYIITFEGTFFYQKGGYKQSLNSEKTKTRNLIIQNVLLTYGTFFAGLYGLFEICMWISHHFHWKLPF